MRNFILTLFVLSGVALMGCTQEGATTESATTETSASAEAINEHCPIMGSDVTAEGGTVEWNEQTVGFCCDGCSEKWQALSEDEKKEALAKAEEGHADHDHRDHAT